MSAKLNIQRESRYADKIRNYMIVLDGDIIGKIADGKSKTLDIKPGTHTLYMKISWCRSNKITFRVSANNTVNFKCANAMTGFKVFLGVVYISVLSHRYIKLERID